MKGTGAHLGVRWLGRVPYQEAWALQRGFHRQAVASDDPVDRLLLLEHDHVYTLGRNADAGNVLVDPASVGAELIEVDRGGDVTYHGPGQLVAYPLVKLPSAQVRSFVCLLEDVLVATLADFGITDAGRQDDYPGVWVSPGTPQASKMAAVGIRVENGRTLHGIALNVNPNMDMFGHIVPCGITEYGVTSMAECLGGESITMEQVTNSFVGHFVGRWEPGGIDRADVVWRHRADLSDLSLFSQGHGAGEATDGSNRSVAESAAARRSRSHTNLNPRSGGAESEGADPGGAVASGGGTSVRLLGRLAEAGVAQGISISERKPDWMRARVTHSPAAMRTRRTVADLNLVTVCEEAGCPNLSECWSDGTATFMVNGERCTRACGFCLVDTRKPEVPDETEPERVAEAVARMGLDFAVVTTVARDDLPDEGAGHIAATIRAIRRRNPGVSVEVLISDCRGRADALALIFDERPDVMNHNVETVPRLQRAVRPSASYARSLSVLARSVKEGLVTKSGLVLGMGETREEITSTLADLAAVGVSIVTIGQYLRPTTHHLPVANWWTPEDYAGFKEIGESLGIGHVESSPFTRSSYHAKAAAEA